MKYQIIEACEIIGVQEEFICRCIEARWVSPVETSVLDGEDLARLRLVHELMEDFGANEEAIPIILHLLDQLYYLRHRAGKQ